MPLALFDTVTVVCDWKMIEAANAIRAVLESYGLRVRFVRLVQSRQAASFFATETPECDYTILVAHGLGEGADAKIRIEVVDQKDGDWRAPKGWEDSPFDLTPATIPQMVRAAQGTMISLACGSGSRPLADAFLSAGYDSYIAPAGDRSYYDGDAGVLFVAGFFYFALANERDYETATYTDDEAVELAAAIDAKFTFGTRVFHRYCRNDA